MKRCSLVILLSLVCFTAHGQEVSDSLKLSFDPYTSLRTHYAILENESEFQDNASRIGFNLRLGKESKMQFLAGVELSIRLIESSVNLNADSRTTSGFIVLNQSRDDQVFAARLGFIGLDFGKYGVLTVGKQWSTYYDISGWTDQFNVFGGTATNTYVANTDGSFGTGRSDQALVYRIAPGRWVFGVQVLSNNTRNDHFMDGYGGSVSYDLFQGFSLGASYQRSLLSDEIIDGTLGLSDHPEYYCVGVKYEDENVYLSAVYARQTNGDLTAGLLNQLERPSVIYDDTGLEIATKYRWKRWRFLAGLNMEWADTDGLPIDPDFHTENYIFGMEFRPYRVAYFYSEYRMNRGVSSLGERAGDVFTLGLRVDLEHHMYKRLSL